MRERVWCGGGGFQSLDTTNGEGERHCPSTRYTASKLSHNLCSTGSPEIRILCVLHIPPLPPPAGGGCVSLLRLILSRAYCSENS